MKVLKGESVKLGRLSVNGGKSGIKKNPVGSGVFIKILGRYFAFPWFATESIAFFMASWSPR